MVDNMVQSINVHELNKRIDNNPNLCLIDVRELDEWNEMHIPHAHHMPQNELLNAINSLNLAQDQAIYLYCRAGVRSLSAAQRLLAQGYTNVYSMDGGIIHWAAAGYAINSGYCTVMEK